MKVELEVHWKLGAENTARFDAAIFALLAGIRETGSLQEASKGVGLSYRHAWGLLGEWAARLGRPLAELKRGRGSQLTPLGSALIAAREQVESRYSPEFTRVASDLARQLSDPAPLAARRWNLFASHDLALLKARDSIAHACGIELEIETHGSLDCLEALARRRCNVAGFHVAGGESAESWLRNTLGRAHSQTIRLIEFARREQGLMLRHGLEKTVRSIADLARSNVRFINRQRGSGTRILFDDLLKHAHLRPGDIRGYYDEEFTHLAVAATIAGGGADAAFGIRAAAAQFALPFVPLERETYYLACREERGDAEPLARLIAFLQSAEFRAECAALPGYDIMHAGDNSSINMRRARAA